MRGDRHERQSRRRCPRRWGSFATVLLIALAACAGSGPSSDRATRAPTCPVDALSRSNKPVEVEVWAQYPGETGRELRRLADRYNASQSRVVVRVEINAPSYEQLLSHYKDAARSGKLPALVIMDQIYTRYLADSGTIVPGQACFRADHISLDQFSPAARASFSVDGALQPVSVNLSAPMMYINRQHFARAGLNPDDPPRTLEQLRAAAEAIRAAGVTKKPLVLPIRPWYIETWITGAGETVVDNQNGRSSHPAGSATLDNPATEYVLTWLRSMVADGLLDSVDAREAGIEHYLAMANQEASISIDTSTAIGTIDSAVAGTLDPADLGLNLPDLPPIALDVGVAAIPGIRESAPIGVGGSGWYLTNTTPAEVQAAAWDFAKFVNSPRTQVEWHLQGSVIPWLRRVAVEPDVQAAWSSSRKGRWLATAYDTVARAKPAFPGPLVGPYREMRATITELVDAAVTNGTNVQDAIAAANGRITTALKHYNAASRR